MFVENYREDAAVGGTWQIIPYPKISDEDWRAWTAFLPVKWFNRYFPNEDDLDVAGHYFFAAFSFQGVPVNALREIAKATGYFEQIEIWGKSEPMADPIAVGIDQCGVRYLICRWGLDSLVPFDYIKKHIRRYHAINFTHTACDGALDWAFPVFFAAIGTILLANWLY